MKNKKYKSVLSLDGGGTRIWYTLTLLEKIDNIVLENYGDNINNYFDWIGGTSSGGIVTILLRLGYIPTRIKEILKRGFELAFTPDITKMLLSLFSISDERYNVDKLEQYLEHILEHKTNQNIKDFSVYSYCLEDDSLFEFKHKRFCDYGYIYKLSDICRCTSAAPTYMKPKYIIGEYFGPGKQIRITTHIDGGVILNNPVGYVCDNVIDKYKIEEDLNVLSIGTGYPKNNPSRYNGCENWGLVKWGKPLFDIMMFGSSKSDHLLAKDTYPNYLRLNTEIPNEKSLKMDNITEEHYQYMEDLAFITYRNNYDEINEFIKKLIS